MKDLISRSSVRNTIFMMRQVEGRKSVLIVEGDSDSKSFGKFVRSSECRIFSPGFPGGKEHALALFEDLRQKRLPGIAVLVDADCDRFWGRARPHPDVCWTSSADREVMMVQSGALDDFLAAHGFTGDAAAFRLAIMRATLPLGCIRIMSRRQNWGLDFKNIDFSQFVDTINITSEERACCDEVLAKNGNSRQDRLDLLQAINEVRARNSPIHDVVCGHDIAAVISLLSQSRLAGVVTPDEVERRLSDFFELPHFVQTSTFQEFVQWELRNAPFVINR